MGRNYKHACYTTVEGGSLKWNLGACSPEKFFLNSLKWSKKGADVMWDLSPASVHIQYFTQTGLHLKYSAMAF